MGVLEVRSKLKANWLDIKNDGSTLAKFQVSDYFAAVSLLLGTGILLHEFLNDRALWLDEARLALNVVNGSYLQLLQPSDYDQGAP
jgi:hypothetical protein